MARLATAATARRSGSGSSLKVALLALVVLGAVMGMLNMAPESLHRELHTKNTRKELRQQTEASRTWHARQEKRLQEEDGSSGSGAAGGSSSGAATSGASADGKIVYHIFETPDGTDADTSLADQEAKAAAKRAAEEEERKKKAAELDVVNTSGDQYHVICSLGAGLYTQWQSRVAYYWYKKVKAECDAAGQCAMGGYTRLLHSGQPDEFMDEIPTVVVDPLPAEYQRIAAGYVVLDRPYAFKQWVEKYLSTIPEKYIWMGEPDHVFLKAPPLWATPERPAAFPFFYIEPVKEKAIIDKFNPKGVPIDQFDTIGNSPVQIHKDQFAAISEAWFKLSIAIKNDTEADHEFGWVQEMYAYSIAAATALDKPVRHQLHVEMQLQPPWDQKLTSENGKDAYMIHFTYGNDFDEKGVFTPGKVGHWHWDKRDWMAHYPPKDFPMPPEGCTNVAVMELVKRVNEAAANLPRWDEYAGSLFAPSKPQGQDSGADQQQQVAQQRRRQLLGTRPWPVLHGAAP